MIFQRKYEKMKAFERERLGDQLPAFEDENLADKLEKNDTLALILSAMLTIIPAALGFLALIALIGYFFIAR